MGGGILSFTWRGIDIFRPSVGHGGPLGLASFPLVPFCNRIAAGCVPYRGKPWMLQPAPLGIEPVHALHGIGWRSPWSTIETGERFVRLGLKHDGALWPWAFSSEQRLQASPEGFAFSMSATNNDTSPMPTGLGLHPYFPRKDARIELGARAIWEMGQDRLPTNRRELSRTPNWFDKKGLDHCFECDALPFTIAWPTHRLFVRPSKNLAFTHVYTPSGEDFFCIEPVSHIPNAVNSTLHRSVTGHVMLEPGETMEIECCFLVEELL